MLKKETKNYLYLIVTPTFTRIVKTVPTVFLLVWNVIVIFYETLWLDTVFGVTLVIAIKRQHFSVSIFVVSILFYLLMGLY